MNQLPQKLRQKQFIKDYFKELKRCIDELDINAIAKVIDLLIRAYKQRKTIFIVGNGGSASTASHMACDLGKGTLQRVYDHTEPRFRVISLTDNVPLMTAYANDVSYDDIYLQQLRNLVGRDDIVIALSGSGNSRNVIKAVSYARKRQAKTIGLLGFKTGGKLRKMVDLAIVANSDHYGPCEDLQLVLNHVIVSWIARVKHLEDGRKNRPREKNLATPYYS